MQTYMPRTSPRRPQEAGFALILAILSLLLLTFLGLTLAATTTTELQIAANHRWGQQARYNAEAGLQAAQIILRDIATQDSGSLALALHGQHAASWTDAGTLPGPPAVNDTPPMPGRPGPTADLWGVPARHFENQACATHNGRAGYGNVLADYTGGVLYQNVTTLFGVRLNGAVTIWVRRPVLANDAGELSYDTSTGRVVVTAEGTAPYSDNVTQAVDLRRRQQAVRVMEVALALSIPEQDCPLEDINQQGLGAAGANFAPCAPVNGFMGNTDRGGGQ